MAPLTERVEAVRREFRDAAGRVRDRRGLDDLRNQFLGRKHGRVSLLFEDFRALPPEEKKAGGRDLNALKAEVQERLDALEAKLRAQTSAPAGPDLTLPGTRLPWGAAHPVSIVQQEIESIFIDMGFSIEEGPEIETDYYNFEALNFPPHHPARDSWDTLFVTDQLLLRTHTSPVQVRVMEKRKPPLRIIIPGRVFRRETPDATHLPMFHQVEGLVVDEGITFAHLKGTLEAFIRGLFGEKTRARFRPSFFPFTEPSAEVDIECLVCGGKDRVCPVCKGTGWKEVLGSGMVHPQVLKNVNIDPEKYSGWAFGLGVDRLAMFLYGLPELRLFYENDLRFLRQFGPR